MHCLGILCSKLGIQEVSLSACSSSFSYFSFFSLWAIFSFLPCPASAANWCWQFPVLQLDDSHTRASHWPGFNQKNSKNCTSNSEGFCIFAEAGHCPVVWPDESPEISRICVQFKRDALLRAKVYCRKYVASFLSSFLPPKVISNQPNSSSHAPDWITGHWIKCMYRV